MWKCVRCGENVDSTFELCWNCGTSVEGIEDPAFRRAEHISVEDLQPPPQEDKPEPSAEAIRVGKPTPRPSLPCLRCKNDLKYLGTKHTDKGFWFDLFFGEWDHHSFGGHNFDVFGCTECGHVELFLTDIGQGLRPKSSSAMPSDP